MQAQVLVPYIEINTIVSKLMEKRISWVGGRKAFCLSPRHKEESAEGTEGAASESTLNRPVFVVWQARYGKHKRRFQGTSLISSNFGRS